MKNTFAGGREKTVDGEDALLREDILSTFGKRLVGSALTINALHDADPVNWHELVVGILDFCDCVIAGKFVFEKSAGVLRSIALRDNVPPKTGKNK